MLNKIWAAFILVSIFSAFFFGKIDVAIASIFESGESAVKICIQLIPGMCFFCGILKIGEASGLLKKLTELLEPLFLRLFPDIPRRHTSISMISMNILSNIFGMGNAASAFGITAMKELQKINTDRNSASDAMCMFTILNTCTLSLFPTSTISLRFAWGSKDPTGVVIYIVIVSGMVCLAGIVLCKIFKKFWRG